MEKAQTVLVPVTVEGVSRMRVDIASLLTTQPGQYRLRLAGLSSDFDVTDTFIVVTRPVSKSMLVLSILFIVAGAFLAIGSLIASVATLTRLRTH